MGDRRDDFYRFNHENQDAVAKTCAWCMQGFQHADYENAVQESWVRIWKNFGMYDPRYGSGRAWACTIAFGVCSNLKRRLRRIRRIERPLEVETPGLDEPFTPNMPTMHDYYIVGTMFGEAAVPCIREARSTPDDQRVVLVGFYLGTFSAVWMPAWRETGPLTKDPQELELYDLLLTKRDALPSMSLGMAMLDSHFSSPVLGSEPHRGHPTDPEQSVASICNRPTGDVIRCLFKYQSRLRSHFPSLES